MKRTFLLCCVSIVLLSAGVASAKNSPYENLAGAANWSNSPATKDYKNILAAAKWSVSPRTVSFNSKSARLSRMQDPFYYDDLFSGPRTWTGCVQVCVKSGMRGTSNMCLTSCVGCALVPNPFGCAICFACGTVGGATVEFCTLHCCVDPGCPASGGFPAE